MGLERPFSRRQFVGAVVAAAAAWRRPLDGVRAEAAGSREWSALGRAGQWLNSAPLSPGQLAGQTVLVNFWTYTCINWLRTLPYVRAWSQRYRDHFTVIGVHTPEFAFERDIENVRRAIGQMGIEYPVVIDNDYAIWRAFDNHYWPALFLIDQRGRIRRRQFGEGEYVASERAIQRLLRDAGVSSVTDDVVSVHPSAFEAAADWANLRSPEAYVGYARGDHLVSPDPPLHDAARIYRPAARLGLNEWSLAGDWTIGRQATTLNAPPGRIVFGFHARDVHLVMGPARRGHSLRFRVAIDGRPPGSAHGLDVDEHGEGTLTDQRLHQLVRQRTAIVDRTLSVEFLDGGAEAFCFTFG